MELIETSDGYGLADVFVRILVGPQSLAKWLFFANQGEFREGDYEAIMNKASCLSLISNTVLVWNTIQIQKIVEGLRLRAPS